MMDSRKKCADEQFAECEDPVKKRSDRAEASKTQKSKRVVITSRVGGKCGREKTGAEKESGMRRWSTVSGYRR